MRRKPKEVIEYIRSTKFTKNTVGQLFNEKGALTNDNKQ